MPLCAACGQYCSPEEIREDTRGDTEVSGAVAWSRVELVHYCPACAKSHSRTSYFLLGAFGLIVTGIVGIGVIGWLVGR